MIDKICREIIRELDIHLFVETGTDMGETVAEVAKWFSDMDPKFGEIINYITTGARYYDLGSKPIKYPVFKDIGDSQFNLFSVDIDSYSYENARKLFKTNKNIHLFCEDSSEFLRKFIEKNEFKSPEIFLFLDAHWGKYWPLRDELKQIIRLKRFIVVIDDFFVPKRSNRMRPHGNFGFDFYHGKILSWGYIYDLFRNEDVRIYYPIHSNWNRRGFVLIFKGYNNKEVGFLKHMPFEYIDKDDPIHRDPIPPSVLTYLDFCHFVRSMIPLPLLRGGIRIFQKFTFR